MSEINLEKNFVTHMNKTNQNRWSVMPLESGKEILKNVIYYDPGKEIPVALDMLNEIQISLEGLSDTLINHLTKKNSNFSTINIYQQFAGISAIKIVIEGFQSIQIGYYLPKLNTFIFGNIGWHKDYYEKVMPNIWPQILEKLQL